MLPVSAYNVYNQFANILKVGYLFTKLIKLTILDRLNF